MIKFLLRLFGLKKKKPESQTEKMSPLSTQDALQKLQEVEDLLVKKQEFIEKKISNVRLPLSIPCLCAVFPPRL